MAAKTWVITLATGEDVATASRGLKDAGFDVSMSLHDIGVITGTGSDDVAARVRALPGVADVARDETVDIGPPGAVETW